MFLPIWNFVLRGEGVKELKGGEGEGEFVERKWQENYELLLTLHFGSLQLCCNILHKRLLHFENLAKNLPQHSNF